MGREVAHLVKEWIALVPFLGVLGCAMSHESIEIKSGIYELRFYPEIDTCGRDHAMRQEWVAVVVGDGFLNVDLGGGLRATFEMDRGIVRKLDENWRGCIGSKRLQEWKLTRIWPGGFEVIASEVREGMESCAQSGERSDMSCESVIRLRYEMVEECMSPCDLVLEGGVPRCMCSP
ncbi:MAG: hypothetical protein NZM37_05950 [Sandaracinaceae bacterium]|nr:hypothetical protein [Sandaracinaceae bacterium]MDW8246053.1 hypothetical protein [Sandaracinaceae bacterium]